MLNGFKTYIGIALAAIGGLAAAFGVTEAADLPTWADQGFVVLGTIIAAIGRWDAGRRAGN
jgi:hypothetical protein